MIESNRQKKIARVLQNDLAVVLQKSLRDAGHVNILLSVTKVSVTTDLSIAKIYVSIFPVENTKKIISELDLVKSKIKHQVAQVVRHQLRKMPDLKFYNDDSLEYIDQIDKAVKGDENPLKNPDLLQKRKKL